MDSKKNDANIKIIDFGTSQIFDYSKDKKEKVNVSYYTAPEVISGKYDTKCDIWSAGVILFALLSGKLPFDGKSPAELTKCILKGKFSFAGGNWTNISKEAKDLVLKMMALNPVERISAEEAVKHSWIVSQSKGEKLLCTSIATDSLQQLRHFSVGNFI